MKKIDNGKDVKEVEEEKEKKVKNMKTNENIDWIEEIKKGKKLAEIKFIEIKKEGAPEIKLCKVASSKPSWNRTPSFSFIWVEAYHVHTFGNEAGYFYKTFRMLDWEIVSLSRWMSKYETKKDFLKDYPEAKEMFWDHPPIPKGKKKIEFDPPLTEVVVGEAFFDGEHLRIIEEGGITRIVEPSEVRSIEKIEDEEVDSDQEIEENDVDF